MVIKVSLLTIDIDEQFKWQLRNEQSNDEKLINEMVMNNSITGMVMINGNEGC